MNGERSHENMTAIIADSYGSFRNRDRVRVAERAEKTCANRRAVPTGPRPCILVQFLPRVKVDETGSRDVADRRATSGRSPCASCTGRPRRAMACGERSPGAPSPVDARRPPPATAACGRPMTSAAGSSFRPTTGGTRTISGAPVDPQSNAYLDFIGRTRTAHPDFGPAPYGFPYLSVSGSQARVRGELSRLCQRERHRLWRSVGLSDTGDGQDARPT